MSRKTTFRPGPTALAAGLKKEFALYYRFARLRLTSVLRKYPEQCFALMVLLILVSASINFFIL